MPDPKTGNDYDYILDDQVGYLMRQASQKHATIYQSLALQGLTATQFATLARLHEQGKCSQNQLGRLASMDVATIKGVVDRLRKKGYAIVEADPNDKRRSLISLTEQGLELVEAMFPVAHDITAKTLEPLTPAEQKKFVKLLRKLT
ncbi:MarR family transcriptional regulator [Sedimentitalea sp. CY04]|uniref:MarR family transcriptional regulator n=1 Tax=Parasedimentitalea denitrificans TaxID=2211118 RepID=A0ABX0WBE7_9RHOB|nr:MarR family transcriptional regulator [Sedimentitalea sp. CY04]NIZ61516.1 MarR family transcriptional regulator [Sedimentitalea sp. CY04]